MSKFEKLYKQICYTWTLRGLNNLLLRNWKFTTMNAPILRQALRSDFTCVTGISASGKYFRKLVLGYIVSDETSRHLPIVVFFGMV